MEQRDNASEDASATSKAEKLSERDAYFQSLRLWIAEAQMMQHFSSCLPFYLMQGVSNPNGRPNQFYNNNVPQPGYQPADYGENWRQRRVDEDQLLDRETISHHGGYEYLVPPLYKRLVAETIDFLLLVFIKLVVAFIAVDYFSLLDLDKFDIDVLAKNFSEEDYQTALNMTQEILVVEMSYRLLVCLFEAWFLSFGFFGGRHSGATPGKALLGLKVVYAAACVTVPHRPQETVLVYPATNVPFWIALARSILKNLLISLLFPVCLIPFVFVHNRTCYDCVCKVIVVEDNMFPPRRNQP